MLHLFKNPLRLTRLALLLGVLPLLQGCFTDHRTPPTPKPNRLFYALTNTNQLLALNTQSSEIASATVNITGLQPQEQILAIDFRPATGQLYGVSNGSRLYVINPSTGAARMIGMGAFSPSISGTAVGFDFNPTVDRIRLVTDAGQNLRLNPETGALMTMDTPIVSTGAGTAAIGGVAYTNNVAGASTTVLYDIDPATDMLYRQDPPNDGKLVAIGSLGLNITAVGGFDLAPDNNLLGLASVQLTSAVWELDLVEIATGRLVRLGDFPANTTILGLAIPTAPVAYAIDEATNNLLIFNPTASSSTVSKTITGLQMGETILGLDMRPANGQLYALGSTSRLYTLNASSGVATLVGSGFSTPALSGTDFGFDFNPTVDRIRVVSNTGQNLRLDPNTGGNAATDGALNPGSPNVTAAAYTNNFVLAMNTTVLYVIDATTDQLLVQTPPNDGTLTVVGSLGINAETANGFDIGGTSGTAYAILKTGTTSALYTINLTTGAATNVGSFPSTVRGFTLGLGF